MVILLKFKRNEIIQEIFQNELPSLYNYFIKDPIQSKKIVHTINILIKLDSWIDNSADICPIKTYFELENLLDKNLPNKNILKKNPYYSKLWSIKNQLKAKPDNINYKFWVDCVRVSIYSICKNSVPENLDKNFKTIKKTNKNLPKLRAPNLSNPHIEILYKLHLTLLFWCLYGFFININLSKQIELLKEIKEFSILARKLDDYLDNPDYTQKDILDLKLVLNLYIKSISRIKLLLISMEFEVKQVLITEKILGLYNLVYDEIF